ncbi:MAG: GNAT family N-acetyltransferase [Peptostreptococcaceae bacterium]|nr:GNAT family N-acetyltransferase [Peptostreptococcaceae bacterium]
MDHLIRELREEERKILDDFLYEAIFVPEGTEPPPKEIIDLPELQIYVKNFGQEKDDHCLVAEADDRIVGAVWVRVMDDHGHVDDETPSLSISLLKEYRNRGIGTELMERMLAELREQGYAKVSLSVQKINHAAKMYQKLGFEILEERADDLLMICRLRQISG